MEAGGLEPAKFEPVHAVQLLLILHWPTPRWFESVNKCRTGPSKVVEGMRHIQFPT